MKIVKTLTAGALALIMTLSFVACEEEGSTYKKKPITQDAGGGKTLEWLAWWDIDRNGAAYKIFQENYGGEIKYTPVSFADRYDVLSKMVTGDTSPDLFPFEMSNFPYGAEMFNPVDDIIDFDDAKWNGTRDIIHKFMWKGDIYAPIVEIETLNLLWYRRDVVKAAGLEDPKELFDAGKWTWDKFIEISNKFKASGEDKYAIDGYNVDQGFLGSTGVPVIGLEDGKLISNLDSPDVEAAVNMLSTLYGGYRYPLETNNWSPSIGSFAKGNTLFFEDGLWSYTSSWTKYKLNDIFFVPYPKYEKADKYYISMRHTSFMNPTGSKNREAYRNWINSVHIAYNDPEYVAKGREQMKTDHKWTDEILDFVSQLTTTDVVTGTFDFKNGIGSDLADGMSGESPVEMLTKQVYVHNDQTYGQLRDQFRGQIEARINELNNAS